MHQLFGQVEIIQQQTLGKVEENKQEVKPLISTRAAPCTAEASKPSSVTYTPHCVRIVSDVDHLMQPVRCLTTECEERMMLLGERHCNVCSPSNDLFLRLNLCMHNLNAASGRISVEALLRLVSDTNYPCAMPF